MWFCPLHPHVKLQDMYREILKVQMPLCTRYHYAPTGSTGTSKISSTAPYCPLHARNNGLVNRPRQVRRWKHRDLSGFGFYMQRNNLGDLTLSRGFDAELIRIDQEIRDSMEADPSQGFWRRQSWFMATKNRYFQPWQSGTERRFHGGWPFPGGFDDSRADS